MKNLILKIRFFFYCINLGLKGGEDMIVRSWVIVIVAGIYFYKDVPDPFKQKVAEELKKMELEDLIVE